MIIEWPCHVAGELATGAQLVRQTIQASEFQVHRIRYRPLSRSWPKKNISSIGLNLQELNRPQRRITNVANC